MRIQRNAKATCCAASRSRHPDAPTPVFGRDLLELDVLDPRPRCLELLDQIWISQRLESRFDVAQINRRRAWNASSAGVGSDHDPVWIRLTGL